MDQKTLLLWSPRILALALSVFFGLFALDAFTGQKPLADAWLDFALHLVPAIVVLTIAVLAWHRSWIGAVAFMALAIAYALRAGGRLDWIVTISGPLTAVALLFLFSWLASSTTKA
jgi:hypothetical protein